MVLHGLHLVLFLRRVSGSVSEFLRMSLNENVLVACVAMILTRYCMAIYKLVWPDKSFFNLRPA